MDTKQLSSSASKFNLRRYIMGGVEALRQVRETRIDMPVVALTASVQDELQARLTLVHFPAQSEPLLSLID
jgi:CheY-like chemotaxis protein